MYARVQDFIYSDDGHDFKAQYDALQAMLFNLLDTPVKSTHHIGGTAHFNYPTEPILDILVGVDNLHDITSLDEKRLNYEGFFRLHHPYKKKVMMAKFNQLTMLKQTVRLHIIQRETPLFYQYLTMQQALAHDTAFAQLFQEKKMQAYQHSETIRQYETQKERIFNQLYKRYLKDKDA
ncbi:GrpB family protein [Staphylococcus auricularis]|uniref:GrpB family protein n=1 Tax=Staphylococcus auricularis TaxID=29379 RepID=A0ABX5IH96_9STAP|nr:GrpB family protein [Staphylococcus auricularis]MCE5037511.1 GrpB family protein [Staphylococcus auricularis]MEB6569966.1 GrpB family protein [Staphylococcus auricularis]PTH18829.1 hypothetical protein BU607_03875 [Staphylococcus auricularis]PTH27327.1 hypothetical protein BU608_02110 [Staphylococcus auricularis]